MSDITTYATSVDVEPADKDTIEVYLKGVDASDFVSEFTVDEILSEMEFADVYEWAIAMKGSPDGTSDE